MFRKAVVKEVTYNLTVAAIHLSVRVNSKDVLVLDPDFQQVV